MPSKSGKRTSSEIRTIFSPSGEGNRGDRETPDLVGVASIDEGNPSLVADEILRELVQCASFSSIKAILRPVLQFMKDHSLWDEPELKRAIHTFQAIMYSIQARKR